jgi:hypothetical protein
MGAKVRRARSGPGLWPGPRRQARWAGRGLQGQRRAAGASRAAGCEAPLRLEEPARTMRGAPPPVAMTSSRRPARLARGRRPGRGAGGRGSGIRRGPQAAGYRGPRCAAARRAVGLASEGRGESCRPATARPRVNPGRLRRVTLAALSLSAARVRPRCPRLGPSGPARRRCALEAV